MNVSIAAAGRHRRDRLLLRREHDLVDLALRGREAPRNGPGARDVAGPAARLSRRRRRRAAGRRRRAVSRNARCAGLAVGRDDRRVGAAHVRAPPAPPPSRRAPRRPSARRVAPIPAACAAAVASAARRSSARAASSWRRRSSIIASASGASSTSMTPRRMSRPSRRLCSRQVSTSGAGSVATARPRTLAGRRARGRTRRPSPRRSRRTQGGAPSHSA